VELARSLAAASAQRAPTFLARAARVVDIPWSIAAGNDLRMPEAAGPRTAAVRAINWYMARLHRAAHHDAMPTLAFHHVANLLAPPVSVMHPRIALRVLRGNLMPDRGKPISEPAPAPGAARHTGGKP
jgi:hypothetical protein